MEATMEPVTVKVEVTDEDNMEEQYSSISQNNSNERYSDQSDDVEQPWNTDLHKNKNTEGNTGKQLNTECQQQSEVKIEKTVKRNSGRPRTTREEKKQKSRERSRRYKAKHVNVGDQRERWAMIKCLTELDNDNLVAKLLLDFYLENHPDLKYKRPRREKISSESDSQSFRTEDTESLNDDRTKTNNVEIKVEINVGDSHTDAAIERSQMKVKNEEIKIEVNDDCSTDDYMSADAKPAGCDEDTNCPSIENKSLILTDSQDNSLLENNRKVLENNRRGSLKRKRLSERKSHIEGIS